jgi:hypothetical protein
MARLQGNGEGKRKKAKDKRDQPPANRLGAVYILFLKLAEQFAAL